jgi:hypothetical protein
VGAGLKLHLGWPDEAIAAGSRAVRAAARGETAAAQLQCLAKAPALRLQCEGLHGLLAELAGKLVGVLPEVMALAAACLQLIPPTTDVLSL